MIVDDIKTEAEYRAIPLDSYSSLKEFSTDRRKYVKKYINGEKVEEKENTYAVMGNLVDCLLLEPEEFDNRYYMSSCLDAPTGLMLEFVEALYRVSSKGNAVSDSSFSDVLDEAYLQSGFKISKEAVLKKFIGSNAEIYFREIREVRSKKLTVITPQDITNAEKVVSELKTGEFTKDIINRTTDSRYTVINQLKISDYTVDELALKSMLDKVIIDNAKKTVQIYDLKCVWAVETFYKEYYLYRRTYIQAYLYKKAVEYLISNESSPCYGYTVNNPMFIVVDSINYYKPLIYSVSDKDMEDAYNGFSYEGKDYPGVGEIIDNLKWAQDNGIWTISKRNYESKGIVKLKG